MKAHLRHSSWLADLSESEQDQVWELGEVVAFSAGSVVVQQGAHEHCFFSALSGRLEVRQGSDVVVTLEHTSSAARWTFGLVVSTTR